MTDGVVVPYSPPARPFGAPNAPPARQAAAAEAFRSLLAEGRPSRPPPPAAEPTPPPRAAPLEPLVSEADGPQDELPPPAEEAEEDREPDPAWPACLQQLAQPPAKPRPEGSAEGGNATAEAGGAAEAASGGPAAKLRAAMAVLDQLGQSGAVQAAEGGETGSVSTAQAGEAQEHDAPNRRLRAAASLSLFRGKEPAGEGRAAAGQVVEAGENGRLPEPAAEDARNGLVPPATGGDAEAASPPLLPGAAGPQQPVPPKAFGAFVAANAASALAQGNPAALAQMNALPANFMRTLEVKLHPAELGSVTARLRITDNQLSVEITTDSALGRDSLSSQESAIRSSLEALGFRIDRLTIQHLPASEASAQTMNRSPDGNAGRAFEGAPGGGSPSRNGKEGERDGGENAGEAAVMPAGATRPGRGTAGLFI